MPCCLTLYSRLQRIKKRDEEQKLVEALAVDRKLRALAEARGRSVPMHHSGEGQDDDARSRGSSRSGRPRSVGAVDRISGGGRQETVYLNSVRDASEASRSGSRALPSISKKRIDADKPPILRSTSGGGRKKQAHTGGNRGGGENAGRKTTNENSEQDSKVPSMLVPMHVQNADNSNTNLLRKRTPIQTKRNPQEGKICLLFIWLFLFSSN